MPLGKPKLRYSGTGGARSVITAAHSWLRHWWAGSVAGAAAAAQVLPPARSLHPPLAAPLGCPSWLLRLAACLSAALGLSDGVSTQKPALMDDHLQRRLPAPPIRCVWLG